MARTWKDYQDGEEIRKETLRRKYMEAIAKEKARGEVLMALVGGKLKAKQISGSLYSGKAGTMARAIRFDIEKVIALRAKQLVEG